MRALFTRRALRAAPLLRRLLVLSLFVSAAVLILAKSKTGVYLGCLTDHFHHARATWNFFNLGFDVYTVTQDQGCARVPYPHNPGYTCTWGTWPVAYPPGMFAVFAIPAAIGRIAGLSDLQFGKITIAYLTLICHAMLWAFVALSRHVRSTVWTAIVALMWIFMVRISLMGLYEAAWILPAVFAVDAMRRSRPALALLWFSASILIGYRAVCLVPLAVAALARLPRSTEIGRTKILGVVGGAFAVAVVIACARALVRNGPGEVGHSPFIPLQPYGCLVLAVGLAVAVFVTFRSSALVGASVAFSSFLSLYHAGHNWHATVCVAPLLAIVVAPRRTIAAQVAIGLWLVFYFQYVFGYPPMLWLEELLRLIPNAGRPGCKLPFET